MHHNNTHTFIDSLLQSQHQFMQAMADHRDQLSETMSSMTHTYLDTSIDRLKRFHDHVANDASGLKSDMLYATLKAAIDQHQHLKDRLTVNRHHANSHKQTLRRLAMGVMATFGVMSGLKAADAFESGQGNGGGNSSIFTTQDDIRSETASDLGNQENLQDFLLDDYAFMLAGDATAPADESQETISATPYSKMMQLLERSSPAKLFDSMFTALTESKLSNENELKTIESKINDHPKLTTEEKKILVSLFNLNSPADIIKAANLVSNIRSEHTYKFIREAYNKEAAKLYTQAANHQDATKADILDGGFGLSSLGKPYKKQAAELFVKAANRQDATKDDINYAISFLRDLGPTYYAQADKLSDLANQMEAAKSEGIFNRIETKKITRQTKGSVQFAFPEISSVHDEVQDQTPEDASTTAPKKVMNPYKSKTGRSNYEHKVALVKKLKSDLIKDPSKTKIDFLSEIYLELVQSDNTTLDKIFKIAQELDKLGDKFKETTLKVIELMLDPSKDPTPRELIFAAEVFKRNTDIDRVVQLCLRAANHPKTSFLDFETIISLTEPDNPKYEKSITEIYENAVRVYEREASDPRSTHLDILYVAEKFRELGKSYTDRAAEYYEKGIILSEEEFINLKESAFQLVIYFQMAAEGLQSLGKKYSNRAVDLNEIVVALEDIIAGKYEDAENSLKKIAQKYPQDSAEYIQYMRIADEVSKDLDTKSTFSLTASK